jgi:hypothetical protein
MYLVTTGTLIGGTVLESVTGTAETAARRSTVLPRITATRHMTTFRDQSTSGTAAASCIFDEKNTGALIAIGLIAVVQS